MFNDLFEDDPFIQEKKAEGRAEGLAEGEARGVQTAVVTVVKGRFPALASLAEQQVKRVNQPEVFNMLLLQLSKAEDENLTRWLLETSTAA